MDKIIGASRSPPGLIVIINKFQKLDSVKRALAKFPRIQMGRLTPHNFPPETQFLSMSMIYPKTNYKTPGEFLEREIISRVPEKDRKDGFAAVFSIEITEAATYPKVDNEIASDFMRKSFSAVNYLATGQIKGIYELLSEFAVSSVSIAEILAVIPFNIFVPDLSDDARNFIIDQYSDIQSKFHIESLLDWAEVMPKELALELTNRDSTKYISDNEWVKVASKICAEARKHVDALN